MTLFKQASTVDELIHGMEERQSKQASAEQDAFESKYSRALELLSIAENKFRASNRTAEAEAVSGLRKDLVKKAQKWAPPWERGPEEKQEKELPKKEELMSRALSLLATMRERKEYVPTILYLRSVLKNKPNSSVFEKLDVEGPNTGVKFLAGLPRNVLVAALQHHFKEFNVDPKEVEMVARRLAPDLPTEKERAEQIAKQRKELGMQEHLKKQRKEERRMQEEEFAPGPVRRIDPETGEITEIPVEFREDVRRPRFMMKKHPKPELTEEEKEALREERKRQRTKERLFPTLTPEQREEDLRRHREQYGHKTMEEVEEAKRREEAERQQYFADLARQREEDEARYQQERARMFGGDDDDWLSEAKDQVNKLEKSAQVNYQQVLGILALAKHKKKDKKVKNPGKSSNEKNMWRMYGYTDANPAHDGMDGDESFED